MSLYPSLIESFARSHGPAKPAELGSRPLIGFGPYSTLGMMHLRRLLNEGTQFILKVDDYSNNATVENVPNTKYEKILYATPRRGWFTLESAL